MTDLAGIIRGFRKLPVFTEMTGQLRFGENVHFLERNVIVLRRKRVLFFGKKGEPRHQKTRFSSIGALNGPSIGTLAVFEAKQPFPGHA